MPYCPNCREEYVEGMSACVECGADLIDGELPDEGENLEDMEPVFYGDSSEALIVKNALEARGFMAYIMGEESALPLMTAGTESVSVLVPRDQADEARDAMEAIRHTEFGEEPMTGRIARPEEETAFTEGPYPDLDKADSAEEADENRSPAGDGEEEPGEEDSDDEEGFSGEESEEGDSGRRGKGSRRQSSGEPGKGQGRASERQPGKPKPSARKSAEIQQKTPSKRSSAESPARSDSKSGRKQAGKDQGEGESARKPGKASARASQKKPAQDSKRSSKRIGR